MKFDKLFGVPETFGAEEKQVEADLASSWDDANWFARLSAAVIDVLIVCSLWLIGAPIAAMIAPESEGLDFNDLAYALFWCGAVCVAFFCLVVWRKGRTPGKSALSLHLARTNSNAVTWQFALVRQSVLFLELLAFAVLINNSGRLIGTWRSALLLILLYLLWPLFDRDHRALHDKFVGSRVVQGPKDPTRGQGIPFPREQS